MRTIRRDLEKLKYDSFLNGLEEAFEKYRSHDDTDRKLVEFAKELIEKFVSLYGDDQETELRVETRKIVMEYFMNNN